MNMNISPALISACLASNKAQAYNLLSNPDFDFASLYESAQAYPFMDNRSSSSDMLALLIQPKDKSREALHAGRNMALFDSESAYKMMTLINNKDVLYKAQFEKLSEMKSAVAQMHEASLSLGNIGMDTSSDSIKSGIQGFVEQYNNWITRFNPDMQGNGLLAGTQAAQVSRYELEQSVENRFNGVRDGLHGLRDLGVTVDPVSKLITLDNTRLDAMLTQNKQGAVDTLQEFSANFAKSAELLTSDNNFILNQLDNLNRAIHYIDDNNASLQAEFGTGDAAKPTGQVAQALAAYNQNYGIKAA